MFMERESGGHGGKEAGAVNPLPGAQEIYQGLRQVDGFLRILHNHAMKSLVPLGRLFAVPFASALIASSLAAQTIVTTTVDENDTPSGSFVSLREAMRDTADGGTISFDPGLDGRVFVLTSQLSLEAKSLTIDATALSHGVVMDTLKTGRHVSIAQGAGLTLKGVTLQNGKAPAAGGAILSAGTLTLEDCIFRDNQAASGTNGKEGTSGTSFAGNGTDGTAGFGGGAISSTGPLTAVRCRFLANKAGHGGGGGSGGGLSAPVASAGGCGGKGSDAGNGGAIENTGSLTLRDCLFDGNQAGGGGPGGSAGYAFGPDYLGAFCAHFSLGGFGGGGDAGSSGSGGAVWQSGSLTAERCTFITNNCWMGGHGGNHDGNGGRYGTGGRAGAGGAVFCKSGIATFTNCTISGNKTYEGYFSGFPDRPGGAGICIGADAEGSKLIHCTVTGNRSERYRLGNDYASWTLGLGTGVYSASAVALENCLIANNKADLTQDFELPLWKERNTAGPGTFTGTPATPFTDDPVVDAKTAVLAVSGNALVHTLLAGSPALNAGVALADGLATDQRGQPRAAGTPDLGAVEQQESETSTKTSQSIYFTPPATLEFGGTPKIVSLEAGAGTGMTVAFTLVSGPATLAGKVLTVTAPGEVVLRAEQPGDETFAAAEPVTRMIVVTKLKQTIPFTAASIYFSAGTRVFTLPAAASSGLPLVWSLEAPSFGGAQLNGTILTVKGYGEVHLKAVQAGNALYDAISSTITFRVSFPSTQWSLTSGGREAFLAEGSTSGVSVTATIPGTLPDPFPVSLADYFDYQLTFSPPLVIPAGQTSQNFFISAADDKRVEGEQIAQFGFPASFAIRIADNDTAYLSVDYPPSVTAGEYVRMTVSTATTNGSPPPVLAGQSLTLTARKGAAPVALTPANYGPVPAEATSASFDVVFPVDPAGLGYQAELTFTTTDGTMTRGGNGTPWIQVSVRQNADGDGIEDLVEQVLGTAMNQLDSPPLTIERNGEAYEAVLSKRPKDTSRGTAVIELSSDLQTWSTAPAASTTVIPNADGSTEKVTVRLPDSPRKQYVRIKVTR
jgi:hypothetical protein